MHRFIVTTHPGMEWIVQDEARLLGLSLVPGLVPGTLRGEHDSHIPFTRLRSIHHIIRLAHESTFDGTLHGLLAILREIDFPPGPRVFRITAERHGTHDFTSMDVQREAGRIMQERFGWTVNLTAWERNILIKIHDNRVLIGEFLTRKSLGRRYEKAYWGRASLQPPVAYALVHTALSLGSMPTRILDPMAGSGTLLFEAHAVWPAALLHAWDVSPNAVEGLRANADKYGIPVEVLQARVEEPPVLDRADLILTDPPFGIRMTRSRVEHVTKALARLASTILPPGGLVVLVTPRVSLTKHAFHTEGFVLRKAFKIEMGGLWPSIMAWQKRA